MPEPISLISSAEINREEFTAFMQECGVVLQSDHIYDGRLSQGNLHVWIALDNGELKNFYFQEIDMISTHLGGRPKTHILLDISQTSGSQKLALDFVVNFAEKWPCVVYESSDTVRVYSRQELLDLPQSSQNFE